MCVTLHAHRQGIYHIFRHIMKDKKVISMRYAKQVRNLVQIAVIHFRSVGIILQWIDHRMNASILSIIQESSTGSLVIRWWLLSIVTTRINLLLNLDPKEG